MFRRLLFGSLLLVRTLLVGYTTKDARQFHRFRSMLLTFSVYDNKKPTRNISSHNFFPNSGTIQITAEQLIEQTGDRWAWAET